MNRIWRVDAGVTKNIKRSPLINQSCITSMVAEATHIFSNCFSEIGLNRPVDFTEGGEKISSANDLKQFMTGRRLR